MSRGAGARRYSRRAAARACAAVLAAVLLATTAGLAAAASAAEELRFVSCPVFRDVDAGRKSGCWLADDPATGRRYDVGNAPTKPDWNFAVLVEGRVAADQPDACGGVVLEPVRVSVLHGESCTRHLLPAEGHTGRRFVLPTRNVRPLTEARPVPPRPWTDRTVSLVFDFDRSFGVYQLDDYLLDQAIAYIRAVKPARIVVTGYAATDPVVVSGRTLAERPEVAADRAALVHESLLRLGVAPQIIEVRTRTGAQPAPVEGADGLAEPSRRRVDIEIRMKP